ncbi:MAG: DNA polymerase III subunit gamma/tau [Firmicutes bacterium]|nr:DNA polymerase III subunit gamma/tau [Bacillota bacterium]
MSYKVLYRKYRPNDFNNVVGQDYTVEMLKNAISTGKHAHAYIFTGPRGTGKTSSAKIFAKALNCEHCVDGNPCNECASCLSFKDSPDIIEIDAASNNGVEEIRELINNVKLVPSNFKYKVYIIDEVHMLTTSAFNALLLTLEEPPSHVVFILATTDIQDVPITILSRCQRFDFKPVNKTAIIERLKHVCSEESIKITDDALEEIALISAGGMRDALGMLDQLSNDDTEITLEMVSDYFGSVSVKKIDELLTSIEENNVEKLLEILKVVKESGTNYTVFIEKLISELRKTAIGIKSGKYKHDMYFDDIYSMIFDLNECLCNININIDPYVLIEIVLLKYINSGNNSRVGLGNNINTSTSNLVNNENTVAKTSKNEKKEINTVSIKSVGNNTNADNNGVESHSSSLDSNVNKKIVIHKKKAKAIDLNTIINNCFVECSKDIKVSFAKEWGDFISSLITKDKSLMSLLADTSILAASNTYVLIQSKINSTNELINNSIDDLGKYYEDYSGNKVKFAALTDELWQKEMENYRNNIKNGIKYNYIEEKEEVSEDSNVIEDTPKLDNIEDVAKDIFGSFEVE